MSNSDQNLIVGKNKITLSAASTLAGAWIVQLIIGAQLAMGNISVYIISYYKYTLGYDDINNDSFYALQPLMVVFATFFFPLGNHLVDKFGGESRPVIAIGGAVSLSIVFLCTYLKMRPGYFILCYSFGMGVFKGFLQSALLRAGWSHLPERKGLVTGCIISGYGFGGFIFGILA